MQPEPKLVAICCGIADSTWRSRSTRGQHALPVKLWRDRFPGLMAAPVAVSAKSKEPSSGATADWVGRTWEYLYRVATGNEGHNSLVKRYGFDEKTANEMSARAKYLAGLRFPRGGFRHHMVQLEPESANPEPKRRLNCPCVHAVPDTKWPTNWRQLCSRCATTTTRSPCKTPSLCMYKTWIEKTSCAFLTCPVPMMCENLCTSWASSASRNAIYNL